MKSTVLIDKNVEMPLLGFGTWHMLLGKARHSVRMAIQNGFTHIDTAPAYFNLIPVGKGIKDSKFPREKLFVTSKLWKTMMNKHLVSFAFKFTLWRLGLEYLDLYLIHWPNPRVNINETIAEIIKLKEAGYIRAWGVSNHNISHLKKLIKAGLKPAVNQVEFHPSLYQKKLLEFCKENGIQVVAHSPFAQGQDLKLPIIVELAEKYKKSKAQVLLNWILSKGVGVIPSSDDADHMRDNLEALTWELSKADIEKIDSLGLNNRLIEPENPVFKE